MMTRETKIGMLVGLAFIIVIGILLSDHMTSSTQSPKALLATSGDDVRRGTITPAAEGVPVSVIAPPPTAPTQQVPTREDLITPPPPQPVQQISVGGPTNTATPQSIMIQGVPQPTPQPQPATQQPIITNVAAPGTLPQWAQQHAGELVAVNPTPAPTSAAGAPMQGVRQYKAEPGDNLSKMANRFLGGNTVANRQAIINANPDLQKNPDRVIVGRTYAIPAQGATVVAQQPQPQPQPQPVARNQNTAKPTDGSFVWYTVQENENLWQIAADHLGSGNEWTKIKELNRDILKSDTVYANQRLRLPAKRVAAAARQ